MGKRIKVGLLLLVGILVALILVVGVGGALLPEQHHASRTLRTKQSPQVIWETLNDHANEPSWRSDVASVTSLGERNGKPVWQENYKDGNKVTLITLERKPPTRIVRELTDLEGPFSGRWEIDIMPTAEGSNVTVTEIGKVSNPFFRFMSKYIIGHTTFMERYLRGLAQKFGEQPQIAGRDDPRSHTIHEVTQTITNPFSSANLAFGGFILLARFRDFSLIV